MKLLKHFDFQNMTQLDGRDWTVVERKAWANKEKQVYVNKPDNLFFDEGLVIQATLNQDVIESVRMHTQDKFYFKYGRIDVVAKVPKGKGTWPAVWLMSQHEKHGGWPRSGEIDLMEHVGNSLDNWLCCLHTESHNHTTNSEYKTDFSIPGLSDDYQTFSLIWEENRIEYLLNDQSMVVYTRGQEGRDTSSKGWPFDDDDFYLIINLAMGGNLGGDIDMTSFPQQFRIKEIKIYQPEE